MRDKHKQHAMQDRKQKFKRQIRLHNEEIDPDGANNKSEKMIVGHKIVRETCSKTPTTNSMGRAYLDCHSRSTGDTSKWAVIIWDTITFYIDFPECSFRFNNAGCLESGKSTSHISRGQNRWGTDLVTCICPAWSDQSSTQETFKTIEPSLINNNDDTWK